MKTSNVILALCIAATFAVLCRLGYWQIQRLTWKEAMIARVETGLKQPPVPLATIEAALNNGDDIEYRPVTLRGTFLHDAESHYFATHKGKSGYFVYTPMRLEDGRIVIVNRGYVPPARKDAASRPAGQVEGAVTIEGLARSAPTEKPNWFVPDNDLAKNVFYWKSLPQMAAKLPDLAPASIVPLFVDAGPNAPSDAASAVAPEGGVTRVTFSNSHLQYAFTWFGLAAAVLVVGGTFLWRRGQGKEPV